MPAVWHIENMNCDWNHRREVRKNGGTLRYGWAIGPDGKRYQHCWVLRNGEIVDLFGWSNHEDLGERYM